MDIELYQVCATINAYCHPNNFYNVNNFQSVPVKVSHINFFPAKFFASHFVESGWTAS